MPRYECVTDNVRKFWEAELTSTGFRTRAGLVGTKGEARDFAYPTAEKALSAFDALVKSKLALGYQLVEAPSAENGAGLWHASNPELEAAILRDDSKGAWSVYGDWLQSQGDLRGELVARARDKKAFDSFVEANEEALFADVLPHLQKNRPEVVFAWRNGFVHEALIRVSDYEGDTDLGELTARVLALPVTRFLRALALRIGVYQAAQDFTGALEAFMASNRRASVRELELVPDRPEHDDWQREVLKPAWGSLEPLAGAGLTSLVVEGTNGHVGRLALPALEKLSLEGRLTAENLRDLVRSKLPALTRLELGLDTEDDLSMAAAPIVTGEAFPGLTHLTLADGYVADLVAPLLFGRLLPSLQHLSLRGSALDEGTIDLLVREKERVKHLKRLVLPSSWEIEQRRGELSKLCKRVTWTRPREPGRDYYDDVGE